MYTRGDARGGASKGCDAISQSISGLWCRACSPHGSVWIWWIHGDAAQVVDQESIALLVRRRGLLLLMYCVISTGSRLGLFLLPWAGRAELDIAVWCSQSDHLMGMQGMHGRGDQYRWSIVRCQLTQLSLPSHHCCCCAAKVFVWIANLDGGLQGRSFSLNLDILLCIYPRLHAMHAEKPTH